MHSPFQLTPITTPADFEVFKGLLLEYAHSDLADPKHSTIWNDIEQLPGRYGALGGGVLLAHAGDELTGCGAFVASTTPGLAEIKRVFVRPGFRRQGLARTITLGLIKQACQAHYQTAGICTWAHNSEALALYGALGFTPIPSFREPEKAHLLFLGLPLGEPTSNTNSTSP